MGGITNRGNEAAPRFLGAPGLASWIVSSGERRYEGTPADGVPQHTGEQHIGCSPVIFFFAPKPTINAASVEPQQCLPSLAYTLMEAQPSGPEVKGWRTTELPSSHIRLKEVNMMAMYAEDAYIPALRYPWLTSLYDPMVAWTTREATFKRALLAQAGIQPGQRVLDLGCGTATLTLALKRAAADCLVVGLDGDPAILGQARAKANRAGVAIAFYRGLSYALPYASESFDRVVSSLFFHHLTRVDKRKTFAEIVRVLKPGGELHVADWGQPQNVLMRLAFLGVQVLDGFVTTNDNVRGLLSTLMAESGLANVHVTTQYSTLFGTMTLYRSTKPLPPMSMQNGGAC